MQRRLVLLFAVILFHSSPSIAFWGNSTFNIGGFFNFYHKDGKSLKINPQSGIMFSEAMRFAMEKINNDSSILYGFKVHEDIKDATNIDKLVFHLISRFAGGKTHCAIGPMLSKDAYEIAFLGKSIGYPIVSYSADYESGERVKSSYFFRTVPADIFRVFALLDVVKQLKWNYISIISSYHLNGARLARVFAAKLPGIDVSIDTHKQLIDKSSEIEYDAAIKFLNKSQRAKGLVLFTTFDDSVGILRALKKTMLSDRFQLLSAYGFSNYVEITSGYEDIVEGAITVDHASEEIPEFRDYFLRLNPNLRKGNKEFTSFWEATFDCQLSSSSVLNSKNKCTGNETLSPGKGYYSNTPVHTVINAAYSMTYAFKHVVETLCKSKNNGYCNIGQTYLYISKLPRNLRKFSFADLTLNITSPLSSDSASSVNYDILNYVKSGNLYKNNKIGFWSLERDNLTLSGNEFLDKDVTRIIEFNTSLVRWKGERSTIVSSVCSLPCKPGEKKVWSSNCQKSSCWDCQQCAPNHITRNNNCFDCGIFRKPDKYYSSCAAVQIKYLDIRMQPMIVVLLLLSAVGFIFTVAVIVTFIKNQESFIVKASGRELCYFILVGTCLCFVSPMFYIAKPSEITCFLRVIFPGLACCMCYAPLFLKTNRIYRIFDHAKHSVSSLSLISPKSQILLVVGIMSMQLLIGIVWAASERNGTESVVKYYIPQHKEYIVLHCGNDASPLALNLILSIVFMIGCTWFAFKTRNYPKNYNEAKYIGRAMYITCILWAICFPAYVVIKENATYTRSYLIISLLICTAYTSVVGLFGQKMKLLLYPDPQDSKVEGVSSPVRKLHLAPGGSSDEQSVPYTVHCSTESMQTDNTSDVSNLNSI